MMLRTINAGFAGGDSFRDLMREFAGRLVTEAELKEEQDGR